MRFLNTLILIFLISATVDSYAQVRNCGSMEYLQEQIRTNPDRARVLEEIERSINTLQNTSTRSTGTISIPVVVHVVYNQTVQNISAAQIQSQIEVLNQDFRRMNTDADGTWNQAADTEIEFCMATLDPNGNSTDGITRTTTSVTTFGSNDAMKRTNLGGKDAWPTSDYLNIWVCNLGDDLLGYAQFPGGDAATDGVVLDFRRTGTMGTATAPYNLGRTATHEVGHWLHLYHIWGDGPCGVDDMVADTPESDAPNYGCAHGHSSCGSVDMIQNYMDYSDDACMNLFTTGQRDRMRALFEPGGFRASLRASNGCSQTPPTPCTGTMVNVSITLDGYGSETTWQIKDNGGNIVETGGPYANGNNGMLVQKELCLPNGCYDFVINDSFGDGLCCTYGEGAYMVTADGNTLASGAMFDEMEATNFCVDNGDTTPPTCDDGIMNGDETGIDCGGANCTPCTTPPTCDDGIMNGDETGIDCGGANCAPCTTPPTCNDGIMNGDETGIDCGGANCAPCTTPPTCDDGIMNGDETGIDCGGANCAPCTTPPTCNDGIMNGDETGIDCGGANCAPCTTPPTCDDGIMNGDETGIDCGGANCAPCTTPPTCDDGIMNGDETGIDCGGANCAPCVIDNCTGAAINLSINFDEFPQETSWSLTAHNGDIMGEGNNYPANMESMDEDFCLYDGCYTLTMEDMFGDGMCCNFGDGMYVLTGTGAVLTGTGSVLSGTGSIITTGSEFGSIESHTFCIDNGVISTCYDGVMNGDETGVDCGGSCEPCMLENCTYTMIDTEDFETGWGIWIDGGSDAFRKNGWQQSNSGVHSIRLRDNTESSVMTTHDLDLSTYEELTVDFFYTPVSMDTEDEDFWLQISTDGGATFTTVEEWNKGDEFLNFDRNEESVVIPGPFTSTTQVRFRCDADKNNDKVYIDDVTLTGCTVVTPTIPTETIMRVEEEIILTETVQLSELKVYPNPSNGLVNISFQAAPEQTTDLLITTITGQVVHQENLEYTKASVNVANWTPGMYIIQLVNGNEVLSNKLIVE